MTKQEILACRQMVAYRAVFEKLIDEINKKANGDMVIRDTEFDTIKTLIMATGRKRGAMELYDLIEKYGAEAN